MKIKRINLRYLKSLYKIGSQQFKGEFWFTKGFLREAMKRHGLFYGAFDKNKLIGSIFVDDGIDRPKAWIFFFDVVKEYRKRGIGNKLLKAVEKKLPKNYNKLYVDFEKTDKLAVKFYKDHGFKKAGRIKDWFGKGTYGLIYVKEIKH
jgi:ribosomal protein S18 acetylase RimI-like enzyme